MPKPALKIIPSAQPPQQFEKSNEEHRRVFFETLKSFKKEKVTWPKIIEILVTKGFEQMHRNTLSNDEQFKQAYQRRKQLMTAVVPRKKEEVSDEVAQLIAENTTLKANLAIMTKLLKNRNVTEQELRAAIENARKGRSWA